MSPIESKKPKILYALQGTGNGHISRARDIIPELLRIADIDILVSGTQADIQLPHPVKYSFHGLSFIFGKKGGIDYIKTFKKANFRSLLKEIKKLDVRKYDLVLNDFEPVSAWACKLNKVPCIGLSHQAAVSNPRSPKPIQSDLIGKMVLEHYAPVEHSYGFHFEKYDTNIFTPVIRSEIRSSTPKNTGHYTIYLPSYSEDRILKTLKPFHNIKWEVFSKHTKKIRKEGNVTIQPIQNEKFIDSLVNCDGIICGAGFETPAEAIFLGKKLLTIPMKGQYEQHCNAAALKKMGVGVMKNFKKKRIPEIKKWLESEQRIQIDFKNETESILKMILDKHMVNSSRMSIPFKGTIQTASLLRKRRSIEKMIAGL
jgi:uncharacterized protein (TIGR00661 family)